MENLVWWVERLIEVDRNAYLSYRWDFEGVREFADKTSRLRKKPARPVLAPRRPGEEPGRQLRVRTLFKAYQPLIFGLGLKCTL